MVNYYNISHTVKFVRFVVVGVKDMPYVLSTGASQGSETQLQASKAISEHEETFIWAATTNTDLILSIMDMCICCHR